MRLTAILTMALITACFGQSFESPTKVDPWPVAADKSPRPYLRISFSSQGSEALRTTAGSVPHKVQWLYVTVENLTDAPIPFTPMLVYPTAIYADLKVQGPEVAAQIIQSTARRSKSEVVKRGTPAVAGMLSLGLALAKAPLATQITANGAPLAISLITGAASARAPNPDAVLGNLIKETLPVVIPPRGVYTGYVSALFDPKSGPITLGIYRYENGTLSLHDWEGTYDAHANWRD